MAVAQGYGKTVTSGSVFAYDVADTRNSYIGRPTTNLSAGYAIYNYNNVPGNVTTAIETTGETYKGAAVYKQTITPLDASGVSYLTNGNNPGIGVYHGGGGGTGGQYSGHTIFFKPVGPMYSSPIFTHYSNIGGWQSSTNYEDMGDGWFRAKVLWYSASTLSDQKFWAINPAGAAANVPITIYWAGPFKENLNSTTISQFVEGTRSATQGLLPLVGNSTIDLTNVSFDSNAQMTFDGTNDYIDFTAPNLSGTATIEMICKIGSGYSDKMFMGWSAYDIWCGSGHLGYNTANGDLYGISSSTVSSLGLVNNWKHYVFEMRSDVSYINNKIYVNGTSQTLSQQLSAEFAGNRNFNSGNGRIADWRLTGYYMPMDCNVFKVYNRALSAGEVRQNYLHYKTRFNLS
jgi:hypothetical protein